MRTCAYLGPCVCVINLGGCIFLRVQAKLPEYNAKKPLSLSLPLFPCLSLCLSLSFSVRLSSCLSLSVSLSKPMSLFVLPSVVFSVFPSQMSVILLPSVVLDSHSVYFSGSLFHHYMTPPCLSLSLSVSPTVSSPLTYRRIPSSQPSVLHLLSPHLPIMLLGRPLAFIGGGKWGIWGNLQLL